MAGTKKDFYNEQGVHKSLQQSKSGDLTSQNLAVILRAPKGLLFTGVLLLILSNVFDIFEMEISGYFILSASIMFTFLILLANKLFISREAQKPKNSGLSSKFWIFINYMKLRLPAFMLFGQFVSMGVILSIIKDWVINNENPPIYSKIKRFINLGLLIQFVIFQMYYSKELKNKESYNFNTAAFGIVSLITFSLIMYLYVIVKFLTVDG